MARQWDIDSVRSFYADCGCTLLSTEYKTKKTKYTFLCQCGEKHTSTFDDFYNGRRVCKSCRYKKAAESNRTISEKDVIAAVSNLQGTFTRMYYKKGKHDKKNLYVEYTCREGHKNNVYYGSIRKGHQCKTCSAIDARKRYQKSLDEVAAELATYGLTLLSSEYLNMDSNISYLCTCGDKHQGTLGNIRKGIRSGCRRPRGDQHRFWNSSLTKEDREASRHYPEYTEWVKSVYERDDYTCQKCNARGVTLNAHHILPYAQYKKLRTELSNGITLCEDCHRGFHKEYGLKNFNADDLTKFLEHNRRRDTNE